MNFGTIEPHTALELVCHVLLGIVDDRKQNNITELTISPTHLDGVVTETISEI